MITLLTNIGFPSRPLFYPFQAAKGLDGVIWTEEERAALQAFLSNFTSKEGVNVTILEAGEGDRSPGGSQMLSEGGGFGEGGVGA